MIAVFLSATAPVLLILLGLVASAAPVAAPDELPMEGWPGSWLHNSRDYKFALFVRQEDDGVPGIRVQYDSLLRVEKFTTDWNGLAEYFVTGRPARFELKITGMQDERVLGTWYWEFPTAGGTRMRQTGEFTLYRTGDGRRARLEIPGLQRVRYDPETGDEITRALPINISFRKASKRIVRWEELPF